VRPGPSSTGAYQGGRAFLIWAGLALLTIGLYWRALHYPFITYDDRLYVSENPHVLSGLAWSNIVWAFTTWHTGNWHPLTWLSLMLDAQLFGKNAGAYHLTNILLHAANAVLLFVVLQQFTKSTWCSAFVAALFAVHPMHVESVAWISERKDVLSALFFVLALGAYGRYAARPSAARYALLTLFFVLGLLAKSMLVTLPFILLLLDFWPLERLAREMNLRRAVIEKLPLFMIAVASCVVTFFAQRSAGSTMPMTVLPFGARVANALLSYERYLCKLFWPRDLVLPYPFSRSISGFEVCSAIALLLAISLVAIRTAHTRGYLLAGWLWFVGMLVPVIGLVQVGPQAMADRYMYLPAIGIFIAFTWGVADLNGRDAVLLCPSGSDRPVGAARRPYLIAVLGALVLIVLSWRTTMQLGYWKDSETLFRHTLAVYPGEIVSLRNLTSEYALEHRPRDAVAILELLLTQTPRDASAHLHLGEALQQLGDEHRAADEYEAVLKFSGDDPKVSGPALNNLAWIRATSADASLRNGAEAVRLAERSCSLSRGPDAGVVDTLAAAYAESGDFNRAIETAERALQLAESAGDKRLAAEISQHVDLYRRRIPLRQSRR
jgi:cytochrome c-type biogenesis protein CcmH/NrfG